MATLPECLMFCFIWMFLGYCQGLQFSLDRTADGAICGHLHCWAHKIFTDTEIFSMYGLTIYDITRSVEPAKIASLSVFDEFFYFDPTKSKDFNGTGHVTWNSAVLSLTLFNNSYCTNRSFMCELDFANQQAHPALLKEYLFPGNDGKCLAVNQMAQAAVQLDERLDQLTELHDGLEEQKSELQHKLDKALQVQVKCTKGISQGIDRGRFLLWENTLALCDVSTDGGGWVIIQRRTKGDIDFYRGWDDYKKGFGTPDTDFWIGNDAIHNLTSQGYTELRIDMENQGTKYYARFANFNVANETLNYRLSVSGYSGTATDSLTFHNNMNFTTLDRDHDTANENLAVHFHGAWWYSYGYKSNLNGQWGSQNNTGVVWNGIPNLKSLTFTEMKVRHI